MRTLCCISVSQQFWAQTQPIYIKIFWLDFGWPILFGTGIPDSTLLCIVGHTSPRRWKLHTVDVPATAFCIQFCSHFFIFNFLIQRPFLFFFNKNWSGPLWSDFFSLMTFFLNFLQSFQSAGCGTGTFGCSLLVPCYVLRSWCGEISFSVGTRWTHHGLPTIWLNPTFPKTPFLKKKNIFIGDCG
jgi:hypothetical protein